jgi:hypothetical protein
MEREGQLRMLSSLSGLAGDAALVALEAGKAPHHALHLLELGRNIIASVAIGYRSQLTEFGDREYPEIIRKFNHLRIEADVAGHVDNTTTITDAELFANRRRDTQFEMDRLLAEIRLIPGYENYLAPQKPSDMMALASDGPIVIVVAGKVVNRSDAIIVQQSSIISISLPKLHHDDATLRTFEVIQRLCRGPPLTFAKRNVRMREYLLWLWEVAVEPILAELNLLTPKASADLPSIHWIGVGPLANAPFHAAGDHTPGSNNRTMAKCISSYLVTLRSLAYARSRPPKRYLNRKQDSRLLVVTMPSSPPGKGQPLPSAASEARTILSAASAASISTTSLNLPTVSSVLKHLPIHDMVHFACHGYPDPKDPSNSHLILQDADLSVAEIERSHAAEADVAYLSACSTANCEDGRLADEGIHLVNSFQLAGFRHVVGTLWETVDWSCEEVACDFYRRLLRDGGEGECDRNDEWDGKWRCAEALHAAVEELRRSDPDLPLLWAPFVHFGG